MLLFPLYQLIYFRIRCQVLLGESDKFFLQDPLTAKVHVKIHHGRLYRCMTQAIHNVGRGFSLSNHSHCARMAEAVWRIVEFEPLGTECSTQILFAEAIDTMASKRGTTLIDE